MSRIQLALNVTDLDDAVEFYSKLLGTQPAKRCRGYANFAVDSPPLKLVLFAGDGEGGTVNHLGIEVDEPDEVSAAAQRLADEGLDVDVRESETCCYATQDKVWASGPDGARWEVYAVLADSPSFSGTSAREACC